MFTPAGRPHAAALLPRWCTAVTDAPLLPADVPGGRRSRGRDFAPSARLTIGALSRATGIPVETLRTWESRYGFPEPERKYYALELTFRRRFADRWMLQGAYTWSHLYGNFEGYVNSDVGQSQAGLNQTFDYPGLVDNGSGDMPQDRRHNLKLFGSYSFDGGLQLGGNLWFQTGRPINCQGVHPTDAWAASYSVASFYCQGQPVPRGSVGTTDDAYALDLMAKYDFDLGRTDLYVRLDVFNLTDANAVTEVDESGDLDTGGVNDSYLAATRFQPPRSVRFGVGVTF